MILLHGLLGSSRNWQTTGADLAAAYHVHALDLRNHGRSPHADEMTYAAMAGDVLAWLDENDLGAATLLGHSMGGKVAMWIACHQPRRVERLVVVDIAPKTYLSMAHRGEFAAMNELDLRTLQSRAEAEMRFEARVPSWAMRKFLTTNLERDAESDAWRWVINLPVLTRELPVLEATPLGESDRFEGATRFIAGGESTYIQPEDSAAIERHFPGARLITIPGAGHNPHMETRAQFVAAVLE